LSDTAVKTAVYCHYCLVVSESSLTVKWSPPYAVLLRAWLGIWFWKLPFLPPLITQAWLNFAAAKRPFIASPDLLSQKAASLRNGRFPWLLGPSPARETMAALRRVGVLDGVIETTGLVVYPVGLEAESTWVSNDNDA
jgi:hypothetical protein